MGKTLLEATLEEYLSKMGMPLGNRIYAEDRDFQAELEDTFTKTKSTSSGLEKLWAVIKEEISDEQYFRGEQPIFLERLSEIFNGLGFGYRIFADAIEGKSASESADEIIQHRSFGNLGSENLYVYYNHDEIWRNVNPRNKSQIIRRFYDDISKLNFGVSGNKKNFIVNHAKEENYDGSQNLCGWLEAIETEFEAKYLDEHNIKRLVGYLKELLAG